MAVKVKVTVISYTVFVFECGSWVLMEVSRIFMRLRVYVVFIGIQRTLLDAIRFSIISNFLHSHNRQKRKSNEFNFKC